MTSLGLRCRSPCLAESVDLTRLRLEDKILVAGGNSRRQTAKETIATRDSNLHTAKQMLAILRVEELGSVFGEQILELLLIAIGKFQQQGAKGPVGEQDGFIEDLASCASVSAHEATRPEFDPSEVTDDKEGDVDQVTASQMHENRSSRSTRRLVCIVAALQNLLIFADDVGVGDMAGIGKLVLKGAALRSELVESCTWQSHRNKAGLLLEQFAAVALGENEMFHGFLKTSRESLTPGLCPHLRESGRS